MSELPKDRTYWLQIAQKLATPALDCLQKRILKQTMPVEGDASTGRQKFSHLEVLGRLLAGLAPWLEHGPEETEEGKLRFHFAQLARIAIDAGTNPSSPDYMNFSEGGQPVVDAAFLSHALIRSPNELWSKLPMEVKSNVVHALKATRSIRPHFNNWLLFSAMVEIALKQAGESWDRMRVDYAIRQHEQWYLGDGIYGDGPEFHWDYYNSFVIHPMLVDILTIVGDQENWSSFKAAVMKRAERHADILERLISPEGTIPPIGRSLTYRMGALQLLAQQALRKQLPSSISPAQVRCGMTAVMHKLMSAPGTFDQNGWLRIGFCGAQPALAESYISTGSLYLCSTGLLPLGLPATDEFWSAPAEPWTSQKVYQGINLPADSCLKSG